MEIPLDLQADILRGCSHEEHSLPCGREVVGAVYGEGTLGLCLNHLVEMQYLPPVPLRNLLASAWVQGSTSDEYGNPWN